MIYIWQVFVDYSSLKALLLLIYQPVLYKNLWPKAQE